MSERRRLPVVYLAGCGHTGSTLLALFLDSHPRIVSVGETSFKPKQQRRGQSNITCTCGRSCVECPFWQEVFRGVNEAGFEFGALQWSNDFRYKNKFAHRLLSRYSGSPARRLLQRAAAFLPSHRARLERVRRVNVEFIRTVLRVSRADVFFDSSKKAVRLHNLIETPELDVKVIRLVRDIRGYVSSAKRRGESVDDAARGWRHVHETLDSITRGLPQDRLMVLRYEDVCRDPATWLRRTYEFCGVDAIDPPPAVVSSNHHVLGNNMRRNEKIEIRLDESWRSRLSRDEQQRAQAIAGTFHARFGYATQ
jgi:hypothetical protein